MPSNVPLGYPFSGFGWCTSLLTLLVMGVQGQEEIESWTPVLGTSEEDTGIRELANLEAPGPQININQATTPTDKPRCEDRAQFRARFYQFRS